MIEVFNNFNNTGLSCGDLLELNRNFFNFKKSLMSSGFPFALRRWVIETTTLTTIGLWTRDRQRTGFFGPRILGFGVAIWFSSRTCS